MGSLAIVLIGQMDSNQGFDGTPALGSLAFRTSLDTLFVSKICGATSRCPGSLMIVPASITYRGFAAVPTSTDQLQPRRQAVSLWKLTEKRVLLWNMTGLETNLLTGKGSRSAAAVDGGPGMPMKNSVANMAANCSSRGARPRCSSKESQQQDVLLALGDQQLLRRTATTRICECEQAGTATITQLSA